MLSYRYTKLSRIFLERSRLWLRLGPLFSAEAGRLGFIDWDSSDPCARRSGRNTQCESGPCNCVRGPLRECVEKNRHGENLTENSPGDIASEARARSARMLVRSARWISREWCGHPSRERVCARSSLRGTCRPTVSKTPDR